MGEKLKILLVDDEPGIVKMVSKRLEVEGFEVGTAMDGEQALLQIQNFGPDLIVLDVMLPKINGYEVCRRLKEDGRYKHIPIVLFTAKTGPRNEAMGLDQGADAYIRKPFRAKELIDAVRALTQEMPRHS